MSHSDQIEKRFQDNSGAQAILHSYNRFLAGVGLGWGQHFACNGKIYIMREHCAHEKSGLILILARVDGTVKG
jgi:hypothetical protein